MRENGSNAEERVILGRVSGVYGVKGWVKIYSYTDPRDNILQYSPWLLKVSGNWQAMELLDGRPHGKGIVARLDGCEDRDRAAALVNAEIAIPRSQLPETAEGDYYWRDLIGLRVVTRSGTPLGTVDHLLETGANDVLVVIGERERLIPYVPGEVITAVDLVAGEMQVDWDPEF